MDSKRVPLKAAVVTVPLTSHIYEINIPLDFCFGNSELYSITARPANSTVHSCSRWIPSVNDCKYGSAALQHHSKRSQSASLLQYAHHVPTPRDSGEDGAGDERFETSLWRVRYPSQSEPGRQGEGHGICLVGFFFAPITNGGKNARKNPD